MDTRGYLIIIIIALLIGGFIGFSIGVYTTIKSIVYVASGFIDIDYDLVSKAIFQYKNNIGGCYPVHEIL